MSFYLLEHPNPRAAGGFHGYSSRRKRVRCIVLHTAETNPSPNSARNIGSYFSNTDRQVSYHTIVDSSQALRLLPDSYTAFHVAGFNSPSLGLSFATWASAWGSDPAWDSAAIAHGARELARMAEAHNVPLHRITAAQARNGSSGLVEHAEMDPGRRSDPGDGFPWDDLLAQAKGSSTTTPKQEDYSDMIHIFLSGTRAYALYANGQKKHLTPTAWSHFEALAKDDAYPGIQYLGRRDGLEQGTL